MVAGRRSKRTTREKFDEEGPNVNIWALKWRHGYGYMKNHRGKKLVFQKTGNIPSHLKIPNCMMQDGNVATIQSGLKLLKHTALDLSR